MSAKECFVDIPTRNYGLIYDYFNKPFKHPHHHNHCKRSEDFECKDIDCNQRYFPADVKTEVLLEHVKTLHGDTHWFLRSKKDDNRSGFLERLENKLVYQYCRFNNPDNNDTRYDKDYIDVTDYEDTRASTDLKLSHGMEYKNKKIFLRLPSSRKNPVRVKLEQEKDPWKKQLREEYQKNSIGVFQGNFDKPITSRGLGINSYSFKSYVSYRHEPVNECKIFDINHSKYETLENRQKIQSYFVKDNSSGSILAGPATSIDTEQVLYTCKNSMCVIPCLCHHCNIRIPECNEHKIIHPAFFDASSDFFIVRTTSNITNINYCDGKTVLPNYDRYAQLYVPPNSLEWRMQGDYSGSADPSHSVYKFAGIKRDCPTCSNDIFHHMAYHLVFHDKCKFCRASSFKFEGIATHQQFISRLKKKDFR